MNLSPEVIAPIISQLGFSAIFLYLYFKERESSREDLQKKDDYIKLKDSRSIEVTDRVIGVIENNTESNLALKNVVEKSIDVNDRVLSEVSDFLRDSHKNG